jgi:hypothetical protein
MDTSVSELKKTSFTKYRRDNDGCPELPLASWNGCWSGIGHTMPQYVLEGNKLCVREGDRESWYTLR